MSWKVYEINLDQYVPFIFYEKSGFLIQAIHPEHPLKSSGHWWDAETKTYTRIKEYPPSRIVTPVMSVKKEDSEDYIQEQIIKYMFDSYYWQVDFKDANIIIVRKDWGDHFEIGSMIRSKVITEIPNERWRHYLDRLIGLRVFM